MTHEEIERPLFEAGYRLAAEQSATLLDHALVLYSALHREMRAGEVSPAAIERLREADERVMDALGEAAHLRKRGAAEGWQLWNLERSS